MTRSRKKTPKHGVTMAESDKTSKQKANRKLRRRVKGILATTEDPEVLPPLRQVSNIWSTAKEGKNRFDPRDQPKAMRK